MTLVFIFFSACMLLGLFKMAITIAAYLSIGILIILQTIFQALFGKRD